MTFFSKFDIILLEKEGKKMLDKAIEHKKEHRKPYRGGKAISPQCRNHGGCPWCEENRKYKYKKKSR